MLKVNSLETAGLSVYGIFSLLYGVDDEWSVFWRVLSGSTR